MQIVSSACSALVSNADRVSVFQKLCLIALIKLYIIIIDKQQNGLFLSTFHNLNNSRRYGVRCLLCRPRHEIINL